MSTRPVTVVGIGADGWDGLAATSQATLRAAEVVVGGKRHLEYLPADVRAERVPLPAPLVPALPGLLEAHAGRALCLLASGDPMFYGIGATLARELGQVRLRVLPHPSSAALACAKLGWPAEDVEVLSAVGRPLAAVRALLAPGRRLLVLSAGVDTPAALASLLVDAGYGASRLAVLSQLGGPGQSVVTGTATGWDIAPERLDALNLVAVACGSSNDAAGAPPRSRVAGLPDEAYEHDGQLTKREVRAVTLARLGPLPGQLLWDVGGGAGSIGIEWMRAERSARAIAIEERADRAERIVGNAAALGVPDLQVVTGAAPDALKELPEPDAVFVGGGATDPGVLDACWDALRPGGRLVVNAVTLQTEALVVARQGELGGDLVRLAISHTAAVGGFTVWRPLAPVTQWTLIK
ncbi:precorrin-6y C5,15-methyltransferase (decarboxylating) subunit CbiE [Sporichthya sp.]|uniref:precorrin-6y C5,15-methyltransferase (decarboxylating) subunit CbiE n=1 Tax=Sporichthya sp. TaxID=65475 RepID=UPI0018386A7F|nr:precorrin-6y C5,15-methyltransferase (decarboxylating) subunit CbiE [Sporichthya sp.]MBA3745768.1 precorrin-6y C5,15-methyltransferase (decarboxylating) subunit CbiE [Sporichthya sp.]